jgi:poly(hydroxyalkanoate) granule-associated protein
MSEAGRTIVERWLKAFASGSLATVEESSAPEIALHAAGTAVRGRSSVRFVLAALREAFPDLQLQTEVLADTEPWVVVRITATGTQRIPLFGLDAGETRVIGGVACFSVDAEGITEILPYVDAGQLMKLLPAVKMAPVDTVEGESAGSWFDRLTGNTRDIWLAGLGALAAVGDRGERFFHALVEHGRVLESASRSGVSTTKETLESGSQTLKEQARRVASTGEEYLREVTSSIRGRLDLPTREEFDELRRKVDQLAAQIDSNAKARAGGDTGHSASA